MADYFHSALRGDQIHEAKVKVLPFGSDFPMPEWEGQMLVIGLELYISTKNNNILGWTQPMASNIPSLPESAVIFERGYGNPVSPHSSGRTSGIIYTNYVTKDSFYLFDRQWIKLGPETGSKLDIIGNSFRDYDTSFLSSKPVNAVLLKNYEVNKKYYFAFQAPPANTIGGTDGYFLELASVFASNLSGNTNLIEINTSNFNPIYQYNLRVYVNLSSGYKNHCNFEFDLEARLIKVVELAEINYGSS